MMFDAHTTTMSVDNSPVKKEINNLNSSGSSVVSHIRSSWADEVLRAERDDSYSSLNSSSSSSDSKKADSSNAQIKLEDIEKNANLDDTSKAREISVEFIDGENEKKFERLVKEEKLKIPFKRRYSRTESNDKSRSNSPQSSKSGDGDSDSKTDNPRDDQFFENNKEKRSRYNSCVSSSSTSSLSYIEKDPATLSRRQKQIDYGKNTVSYERYIEMIPKSKRTREQPKTPNKYGKYSRRAFDGLIKIWRKQLHYYNLPNESEEKRRKDQNNDDASSSDDSDSD